MNLFGARANLPSGETIYRLDAIEKAGIAPVSRLPFSVKVLLEAALRTADGFEVTEDDVQRIATWDPKAASRPEVPFKPARVLLQDFTGVPCVADLAAMRSAVARMGGDPKKINPLCPVDLVIDHSVQVDVFGSPLALAKNAEIEFQRNRERYEFLRWGQKAIRNFRCVPPATGIVHQVNLEFLAKVVFLREGLAFPDTLVGTDSHTTMINGLGVLGWGVGGIEAEAVMLGQPIYMLLPDVVGVKLHGELREGVTATDVVLTVTQLLRKKGVVDKFVEFCGPGLSSMSLADRATVANMAPEYGATIGFFPIDRETLDYLRRTGRTDAEVSLVERYAKEQGLFRTDETPDPVFTDTLSLDLSTVEPSLAGPKRPQDRVPLRELKDSFRKSLTTPPKERGFGLGPEATAKSATAALEAPCELKHGAVVIAAITSCTNTSNPSVMLAAGLLAKKAVERGLRVSPAVKTSLAPGSKVVTEYLRASGLLSYLEKLGFFLVGYGCTTCIGNSGPLPEPVRRAIEEGELVAASVLSGNRNFEGRINPHTRANYLASPPLVVAFALAGTVDIDLFREPIGRGADGKPVFLREIWPTQAEIREAMNKIDPDMFRRVYSNVWGGNPLWDAIEGASGDLYTWSARSTYIQEPPFFQGMTAEPPPLEEIRGARVLALLGDSVTTDHISPAGEIDPHSPAGAYLIEHGVGVADFNSYGARRGNHNVMVRGTFANVRLKNLMVPGLEGWWTVHQPSGERMSIFDAAERYRKEGRPLVVIAGKEYGTGSSRDWAAKGPRLLGVRAVIAESFERIHRSNLVGMGVLPLQFAGGENAETFGFDGSETFDVEGIAHGLAPKKRVRVTATRKDGSRAAFLAIARLDTPVEVNYYRHGGILQAVLRALVKKERGPSSPAGVPPAAGCP